MKFTHTNLSTFGPQQQSAIIRALNDQGWHIMDEVPDTEWQRIVNSTLQLRVNSCAIPFEAALAHEQYCRIPRQVLASVYGYVNRREITGHFLTAVLSNNLFDAVGRADKESMESLRELVVFIHMEVPSCCHGSLENVAHWLHPKPNKSPE